MTAEEVRTAVIKAAKDWGLDVMLPAMPNPIGDHFFIASGPEAPYHFVIRAWEVEGTLRVDLYGVIKTRL